MFENELDRLRYMLDAMNIPYENYKEKWNPKIIEVDPEFYSGNNRFRRNQIIYGRKDNNWKIDGICQMGSYGAVEGLIETYGTLGVDAEGDPLVLNADEVFQIIAEDWKEGKNDSI